MKKTKKTLPILLMITLLFAIGFSTISFASPPPTQGGISNAVKSAGSAGSTGNLETQADTMASEVVTTARTLGIIALVILVIICGARLMFGGEKGITTVKVLAVPILLAAFLVFKTESVVAAILNVVGYMP